MCGAMHRLNSTSSNGSNAECVCSQKNSVEKRIAMLERELEIKNRAIESLQEACKNAGASEVVEEASDNIAPPLRYE